MLLVQELQNKAIMLDTIPTPKIREQVLGGCGEYCELELPHWALKTPIMMEVLWNGKSVEKTEP